MLTHGLHTVSFYRPDTGDVVQLNKLTPDSTVRLALAEGGQTDPTGGEYFPGGLSELDVHSLDLGSFATLKGWMKAGYHVSAVGVGPTGALQWYETDKLKCWLEEVRGKQGGRVKMRVQMRREGHGTHNIHFGLNLLAFLGWGDANGDGVADGYQNYQGAGAAFADGGQTITHDLQADAFFGDIPFPIVGVTLHASVTYDEVYTARRQIIVNTLAGTTLSNQYTDSTFAGRAPVVSQVIPAGGFTVRVTLFSARGATLGVPATFRDPSVRVDGSSEYVAH